MPQPNIIFIHVDEMRYPMHLPTDTPTPAEFLTKYMPNLYSKLWKDGVKFKNYYAGAADCTPGRGAFVTGLYAYQTGLFLTRESTGNPYATKQPQPALHIAFPTYGKLLKDATPVGYETPYIGKWHLSNCPDSPNSSGANTYLNDYGFQGLTMPDPLGMPSQGLGLAKPQYPGGPAPISDADIAAQAVKWLYDRSKRTGTQPPFCLTVGFVNPHDKQFFWGGTQANEFNGVYSTIADSSSLTGFETPAMGFSNIIAPPLPPSIYKQGQVTDWNWQPAQALESKPKLQTVFKNMFSYFWTGQIHEDPSLQQFGARNSPYAPGKHDAVAPNAYWYRALDFYTQMMSAVDVQIGQVLHNIPANLVNDTIIVFSADHGEYASSHGLQGKGGSVYKECFNVPLIVYDPQGAYAKYPGTERKQLVSGVDLLRMLVTIGNEGHIDWLKDPIYFDMWGGDTRADVWSILQIDNATAGGRPYVIYSTDEFFKLSPDVHDDAPQHVIGLLANTGAAPGVQEGKLGFYHHWKPGTTEAKPAPAKQEFEYYNYATADGKLEKTTSAVPENMMALLNNAIQNQLNKQLPTRYREAQQTAIRQYWDYVNSADFPHVSTAFA
jgi:arylsulfatase A-like enzyme